MRNIDVRSVASVSRRSVRTTHIVRHVYGTADIENGVTSDSDLRGTTDVSARLHQDLALGVHTRPAGTKGIHHCLLERIIPRTVDCVTVARAGYNRIISGCCAVAGPLLGERVPPAIGTARVQSTTCARFASTRAAPCSRSAATCVAARHGFARTPEATSAKSASAAATGPTASCARNGSSARARLASFPESAGIRTRPTVEKTGRRINTSTAAHLKTERTAQGSRATDADRTKLISAASRAASSTILRVCKNIRAPTQTSGQASVALAGPGSTRLPHRTQGATRSTIEDSVDRHAGLIPAVW